MILRRNPFHRFSKFSNLWNYIGKRNLYQTGEFEWSSFLPEDTYDSFSENSSHGPKLCESKSLKFFQMHHKLLCNGLMLKKSIKS